MRSKEGSCFVLLISFPNYRHRNTPDGGRQTNEALYIFIEVGKKYSLNNEIFVFAYICNS